MLTCLAMALATVSLANIPTLATHVETEARTLSAQTEVNDRFIADLHTFSAEAMQLSDSLRAAGVTQDLPCIFRGISQDTETRITELQAAHTQTERTMAFNDLRALLSDAILIAPMAAGAAADAQTAQNTQPNAETETADRR